MLKVATSLPRLYHGCRQEPRPSASQTKQVNGHLSTSNYPAVSRLAKPRRIAASATARRLDRVKSACLKTGPIGASLAVRPAVK